MRDAANAWSHEKMPKTCPAAAHVLHAIVFSLFVDFELFVIFIFVFPWGFSGK